VPGADSFHFDPLSIPFLIATAAVLVLAIYAAVMRGVPVLRAGFLLLCASLLPFVIGLALVGSTRDPEVARSILRVAVSLLPMASAGALLFEVALVHRLAHYRWLVTLAVVSSLALIPFTILTDQVIAGVWKTPSGLWYMRVGELAFLQSIPIGLWVAVGVWIAWRRLPEEPSESRRRAYRGSIVAFATCSLGLVDVPLGYGVGWYPLSWLFLTIGAMLALRSLIAHDLIRASTLDARTPLVLLYLGAAAAGVWIVISIVGTGTPPLAAGLILGVFLLLRIAVAVAQSLGGRDRTLADTPLERVLEQYLGRVQTMAVDLEVAAQTVETVRLATGCENVELLVPAAADYSWLRADGQLLAEERTPDPLLVQWLAEHERVIARDDIEPLRLGDLRQPLESLFEAHEAELLIPLVSRDEVVGLVVMGALHHGRALRPDEASFLVALQQHATAALVYARMARQAATRVEVDKEVELAATVQRAFVPGSDTVRSSGLAVSGIYAPASRCGGDWWSVHPVPGGGVLILIGDVTGHGVPAAMVTAAAKGCYDAAQRLMGARIDLVYLLELLDAAVRRAGAGEFHMTCFATLVDPAAGTVTYANAGHVIPYLCRATGPGACDLEVLVSRGNPLGAGHAAEFRAESRTIREGDLLIWYTDGLVECTNGTRAQFGDRRMQRILRKAGPVPEPHLVRDQLVRAAHAFMDGHPPDDDITLVVARIEPPA
jgi:serine phosphatase RsbU (regulator of sigma subunit)